MLYTHACLDFLMGGRVECNRVIGVSLLCGVRVCGFMVDGEGRSETCPTISYVIKIMCEERGLGIEGLFCYFYFEDGYVCV